MRIFRIKNQYRKGFGLLEVLISAVIIIMILAALVFIGKAALSNNEYLNQRAQAVYLAQEAIEMTRQMRDTNWIDGDNTTKWNTLHLDVTSGNWTDTPGKGTMKIIYKDSKGRIILELMPPPVGADITVDGIPFKRMINIYTVSAPLLPTSSGPALPAYSMKVTSKIEWTFSGQPKKVEVSEILTNWRPDF